MKIWVLPLEPLEQRYTGEWYTEYRKVLEEMGVEYEYIDGRIMKSNLAGVFFLDPVATNFYKLTQLSALLERIDEIKDDDWVYTMDLWHTGIEALAYVRDMLGKKFKISGFLHAGTYDKWDLTNLKGMSYYGKALEEAWFAIADLIFVATEFHAELICQNRFVARDKIIITGAPLDVETISKYNSPSKKPQAVFTGRKCIEKGYPLVQRLQARGLPIIVSLDGAPKSKLDYYKLLGESKVILAPSLQETFGYGVVEGMACGCIPMVPDALSFRDTVPIQHRYSVDWSDDQIAEELEFLLNHVSPDLRGEVERFNYYDVIEAQILAMADNG